MAKKKPNQVTCDYCGKENPKNRCLIGYGAVDALDIDGKEFAWVLWEGTGKTSCDSRD